MPRRPCIKLAGHPQHIVQRGINREPCVYAEEDYHCYLLTGMRYIELNPVRAAMGQDPSRYRWSSYRHNSLEQAGERTTTHLALGPDEVAR